MSLLLLRLMRRSSLVALVAFCTSLALMALILWQMEVRRQDSLRTTLLSLATDQAQSVRSRLDRLLSTTYLLAAVVRKDGGEVKDFHQVADEILPFFPGIASLSLSPGGVIRYAAPREANARSIGFNQLQDPAQSPEAFLARDTGRLTLAGPLDLVQGGRGVVGRLPIFLSNESGLREFWGFANAAIRFPEALESTGLETLTGLGYAYELWRLHPRTGERQIITASGRVHGLGSVDKQVEIANISWMLSLAPVDGWITTQRVALYAAVAVLLSLLLAYLAKLWATLYLHRQHLEGLVDERTSEIQAARQRLQTSEERLSLAMMASRDAPWDWNLVTQEIYVSPQWWEMVDMAPSVPKSASEFWPRFVHPDDEAGIRERFHQVLRNRERTYTSEFRLKRGNGSYFPVMARAFITYDAAGQAVRMSGTHTDLTETRKAQRRERLRTFLLGLLTQDLALPDILDQTVLKLESTLPDSLCSILLLDEDRQHLRHGSGPNLPEFYLRALDGAAIGPREGACGAAAYLGRTVISEDIATDPHWNSYRELAQSAGLASCWSHPIVGHDGRVLGSFAVYHRRPASPTADELLLIEEAAHFTALAIERKRAEGELELAAAVFEQSSEGFVVTDADLRIVKINPAFTTITGYDAADAVGQTPRMLASGHHGREFYQRMWHELDTSGQWQGEIWNRRKDGQVYPEWLSITRVRDAGGQTRHYIAIFSDTSQRKAHEAQIRTLAHYDALTGLANRTLLRERVDHDLNQARRHGQPLALLFLDLDHFKNINDSLGHHLGDLLLVEVGQRLSGLVRAQDTVARLGGDEFVAVLPDTHAQGAAHIARKLLERIAEPYLLEQHELTITPSIGIAMFPDDGQDYQTLYRCADTAMYRAKQDGRNGYSFFTAEMQANSIRTLQLDNALRRALERDQLQLHYQPQLALDTGRVIGVEALLRWNHPEWGPVSPAEFIPVAESSGQILQIGEWVLRTATRQLRAWQDAGLQPMVMAVNLSAVQFRLPRLPELVMDILGETGLAPDQLELELTESVAMHDPQGAVAIMNRLHERGILMSVDDFGTGYSSLSYLKRFRVYKLKIDQTFVRDMCSDPEDALIVGAIINLAQSLGLRTIAEGVENPDQLALLRARGCTEVQGYHIARPMTAQAFETWLRTHDAAEAAPG